MYKMIAPAAAALLALAPLTATAQSALTLDTTKTAQVETTKSTQGTVLLGGGLTSGAVIAIGVGAVAFIAAVASDDT